MSNVREVKPRIKTITLRDGVERKLCYTLNALAELEDRYGSVDAAFKALESGSIKAARCVLWAGLIDEQPDLTEKQVGSLIDMACMSELMDAMGNALGDDMPQDAQVDPNQPVAILPNV